MQDAVVIINGLPRSGKDSFCKYIEEYAEEKNFNYCYTWSTIDVEKEILEEYVKTYDPDGFWSSTDRAFLCEFKQLLNKYYDFTFDSFKSMVNNVGGVVLIQSREWEEILDFKEYCQERGIKVVTVFIGRMEQKHYDNSSDYNCDANIQDYDYYIFNDGTLEELKQKAREFCNNERLF